MLPAKTKTGDRFEIVETGDLDVACRAMASGNCSASMPRPSSLTWNQGSAAARELDVDGTGAAVDRVLQQFFQCRCGRFDHFAGGDLIDQMIRQGPDLSQTGDSFRA